MSTFTIPNIFVANTVIKSADMNANFAAIANLLNTSLLPVIGGNPGDIVVLDTSGNLTSIPAPEVKGDLLTFSTVPDVLPVGTDGSILTADSTQTSGIAWKPATSTSDAGELINLGLAVSASSGALNIAIKQADGATDPTSPSPVTLAIRSNSATVGSYNLRSITAAQSLTISQNTTLGMVVGQSNVIWVYAIDTNGLGTMGLGVSTVRLDEGILQNTTPETIPVSISLASPAVISGTGFSFITNDAIVFTTTGSLPTGITAGTTYFIQNPTSTTFNIAPSPIDAPINTSGSQSGVQTIHVANSSLVSSAIYMQAPVRLIGKVVFNLVTSGVWITPISVQVNPSLFTSQPIGARYYDDTGGTFSTGTARVGSLTNVVVDTLGSFVNSTFVAPSDGMYEVDGAIQYVQASSGFLFMTVYVNGSPYPNGNMNFGGFSSTAPSTNGMFITGGTTVSLKARDAVTLFTNASGPTSFNSVDFAVVLIQ